MAGRDDGSRLKVKQAFHDAFSALDQDDEGEDVGRLASVQALRNAAKVKANVVKSLPRSASDTDLAKKGQHFTNAQLPGGRLSTSNARLPNSLIKGQTSSRAPSRDESAAVRPSSAGLRILGKRKRNSSGIKLVAEHLQVFKGLRFYFFPNNDSNPARRLRIAKALEFGASWQKEWNDSVTHVIVDDGMDYSLLMRFLKMEIVPPKVMTVSQSWPSECISYRTLLDPTQPQFRVKGYTEPDRAQKQRKTPEEPPRTAHSNQSLQLKPAGKAVMARQPETPKTDEAVSSQPTMTSPAGQLEVVPNTSIEEPSPQAKSTVEFDAAIAQARGLQELPLDHDEVSRWPTSSEEPVTDDEESSATLTLLKKPKTKFQNWQDSFQCMRKHTGEKLGSPNASTIAILQQMADYYRQIGDEWRIRAYRNAIATLRNHSTKVCTKEEALALPQVGERLATKIEEIAFTNRLRRLDNARAEPKDQVLQTFMQVYGVGFAQASTWVNQGYTTLDELLEKAELTENQRIGIEHYEDFNTHIPRAEVEQHGNVIRKTLQKMDPYFEVIVGGSYRRGAETSGDIDCIITRPSTDAAYLRQIVLDQLVPKLTKSGFLVASLAATSRDDGSKWHGASSLPLNKVWRRMDLLLVPSEELGAALMYFTGNDIFNRSLRLLASKKGMRLNQRGLYKDVMRGKGREKLNKGTLIEGKDEKRIFEILGVPWRPPEHRRC